MNLITDTWRGLVRRKLWPVALLLVAALVAVPMVLAKEPDGRRRPRPTLGAPRPTRACRHVRDRRRRRRRGRGTTTKRRRMLGAAKDPFAPAPLPKAKKTTKQEGRGRRAKTATEDEGQLDRLRLEEPPRAAARTAPTAPVGHGHADRAAGQRAADPGADVPSSRSRSASARSTRRSPRRRPSSASRCCPDEDNPVLVYRGVEDGGKVAVFELTGIGRPSRATAMRAHAGGLPVPQAARRRDRVHHGHRHGHRDRRPVPARPVKINRSDDREVRGRGLTKSKGASCASSTRKPRTLRSRDRTLRKS